MSMELKNMWFALIEAIKEGQVVAVGFSLEECHIHDDVIALRSLNIVNTSCVEAVGVRILWRVQVFPFVWLSYGDPGVTGTVWWLSNLHPLSVLPARPIQSQVRLKAESPIRTASLSMPSRR